MSLFNEIILENQINSKKKKINKIKTLRKFHSMRSHSGPSNK